MWHWKANFMCLFCISKKEEEKKILLKNEPNNGVYPTNASKNTKKLVFKTRRKEKLFCYHFHCLKLWRRYFLFSLRLFLKSTASVILSPNTCEYSNVMAHLHAHNKLNHEKCTIFRWDVHVIESLSHSFIHRIV